MAIRDARGNLHSEINGRFIEKQEKARRIYDSDYIPVRRIADPIPLKDEQLPRSVGAKWKNEDILMPDGSYAHFVEGTKIQNKEVFAGKGCRRKIDARYRLAQKYKGSKPEEWQKVKGWAYIQTEQGEIIYAEIHWFEEPSVGKVEFKYKNAVR